MIPEYKSTNRRKKNPNNQNVGIITGVIIFSVALLLIGLFAYSYTDSSIKKSNIDELYCRKDGPQAVTSILIDHTDKINATQRAALEKRLLDDVISSIPKNSVIKVYSVDKIINRVLTPEIDLCNPGNEKNVSRATGNPALVKKRYEEKFMSPIKRKLENIILADGADESPILESLQSVTVSSFLGNKQQNAKKKLILVSDLLQHNQSFSFYKTTPEFNVYQQSSHWKSVRSDLTGVEVEIFFLRREGANELQNSNLRAFWIKFFEKEGARVTKFVPIEG